MYSEQLLRRARLRMLAQQSDHPIDDVVVMSMTRGQPDSMFSINELVPSIMLIHTAHPKAR